MKLVKALVVLTSLSLLGGRLALGAPAKPSGVYAGKVTSEGYTRLKGMQRSLPLYTTRGFKLCKLPSTNGPILPMKGTPNQAGGFNYSRCTAGQYVVQTPQGQSGNFFRILKPGQRPPVPNYN